MDEKIIQHKNPEGRVSWYRAVFVDNKGQKRFSPRYLGKGTLRNAQNWLYANTRVWCNVINVEQRIVDNDGASQIIQLGKINLGI